MIKLDNVGMTMGFILEELEDRVLVLYHCEVARTALTYNLQSHFLAGLEVSS